MWPSTNKFGIDFFNKMSVISSKTKESKSFLKKYLHLSSFPPVDIEKFLPPFVFNKFIYVLLKKLMSTLWAVCGGWSQIWSAWWVSCPPGKALAMPLHLVDFLNEYTTTPSFLNKTSYIYRTIINLLFYSNIIYKHVIYHIVLQFMCYKLILSKYVQLSFIEAKSSLYGAYFDGIINILFRVTN